MAVASKVLKAAPCVRLSLLASLIFFAALLGMSVSSASAITFGFQTSSSSTEGEWDVLNHTGATSYRTGLDSENWSAYDPIFEEAWKHGITVLPVLGGNARYPVEAEFSSWAVFAKRAVARYGVNGSFWEGKANPTPVTTWEIWNEPNLPAANPVTNKKNCEAIGETYVAEQSSCAQPLQYGKFLVSAAVAVREQQNGQGGFAPTILFGGMYSPTANDDPRHFLEVASTVPWATAAYDGVGFHPYAPYNTEEEKSETGVKVKELEDSVNGLRATLNAIPGGNTKSIWLTEIGWPVISQSPYHPSVTEKQQANLLTKSFNWARNAANVDRIAAIYWYNYRDSDPTSDWDYRCGLRDEMGNFRPSWYAFEAQTGAERWPVPRLAIQANTGTTYVYAKANGATNTLLGMEAGTSPSIGQYRGSYEVALHANTGTLWTWTPAAHGVNTGLAMAPGTNPSVTPLESGKIAYQGSTGTLWTYQPGKGAVNTGLKMAPGTSPSITFRPAAYWQPAYYRIAYQGSNGNLILTDGGSYYVDTGIGMATSTSPSVAAIDSNQSGIPGREVAVSFQANTGQLWLYEPGGTVASTGLGMYPKTSPSTASLAHGGYVVSFQANTGQLWFYQPGGAWGSTGYGMQPESSPSVIGLGDLPYMQPFEMAINANTGVTWTYEPGGSVSNTLLGSRPATSPSIAPG